MRIKIFKRRWSMDDHTPVHKCNTLATIEAHDGENCVLLARKECAERTAALTEKERNDGVAFEFTIIEKGLA